MSSSESLFRALDLLLPGLDSETLGTYAANLCRAGCYSASILPRFTPEELTKHAHIPPLIAILLCRQIDMPAASPAPDPAAGKKRRRSSVRVEETPPMDPDETQPVEESQLFYSQKRLRDC